MIAYNITEALIIHTVIEEKERKYDYKVNFSVAAHICRAFFRPISRKSLADVAILQKELIPIRRRLGSAQPSAISCNLRGI